ncbi:MAG: hypothetical protein M3P26_17305 [Gemmatimonadota bacterium]|nr:hypothetical protein [Gemmatimonadota bacterium]
MISAFTSDVQFGLEAGSWPFLACYKGTTRIYAPSNEPPPEFLEMAERVGCNWKIISGDDADSLVTQDLSLSFQDPPFDEVLPHFAEDRSRAALGLGLIDMGDGEHFVPYASITLPAKAFQALVDRVFSRPRIFVEIDWRGFCGPHVPFVPSYTEFLGCALYLTREFSIELREPYPEADRLERKPGQRAGD